MTPQQIADELLAEHQRNRNMTLHDWDQTVKPHLDFIGAGAAMAARHANALPCKADFATLAQGDLAEARKVLEIALQDIIAAQSIYANKPAERDCAA